MSQNRDIGHTAPGENAVCAEVAQSARKKRTPREYCAGCVLAFSACKELQEILVRMSRM